MKHNPTFVFATAIAGLIFTAPLASQDITVTPPTFDQFVSEVSDELNRELGKAHVDPWKVKGGLAQVRFQVGSEGIPENIELYRRSGDPLVDRVAIKVVSRLNSMNVYGLPNDFREDQLIQANIIWAVSHSQMERLEGRLARLEATRIAEARNAKSPPVLALTVLAKTRS